MIETIFFILGTLVGSIISWLSFRSGSKSTHRAYDVVYSMPEEIQEGDQKEPKIQTNQEQLYDWDGYMSGTKHSKFEEDDDNLEEKPN